MPFLSSELLMGIIQFRRKSGGPRPACARIGFSIASARPAASIRVCISNTGSDSGEAISASAGVISVGTTPGYDGHVAGALKCDVVSFAIHARVAAAIAQ